MADRPGNVIILRMRIRLGYCPAPDGGFIIYGLAAGKVGCGDMEIELISAKLPALNDCATRGELEATMISVAAYPYLRQRYVLARCGVSFVASGRGPVLAAREPLSEQDLETASVAVPDSTSSAILALQIHRPGIRTRLIPADKVAQAAKMGLADCALLPSGDTAMCRQSGLYCVADLAAGWAKQSGQMPLPMTCFAIRSDLPDEVRLGIETALRDSIRYALAHRAEASAFAAQCARGTACWEADPAALGTYVSEHSLDVDDPQRLAVEEFLRRGHDAEIVPNALPIRFVGS